MISGLLTSYSGLSAQSPQANRSAKPDKSAIGREYISGIVRVRFRPNVLASEAKWVLESYGIDSGARPFPVSHIRVKAETPSDLLDATSIIVDLFQSGSIKESAVEVELSSNATEAYYYLTGQVITNESLQRKLISLLPTNVRGEFIPDALYLELSTSLSRSWLEGLRRDEHIESAQVGEELVTRHLFALGATVSQGAIASRATITGWRKSLSNATIAATVTASVSKKSTETDVAIAAAAGLPTATFVVSRIKDLFATETPTISLVVSERDQYGEYFEILVRHVKGAITRPPYWEKLRYLLPIYSADDRHLRIRCILSGEYSPGIGTNEPPDSSYRDLEPLFSEAMRDNVARLLLSIQASLQQTPSAK
jgi:hypothetical protein